ncbi:ABC transporter-related protein [Calothrix parasitica NIES-267]|uniref:ABC transporter-related protein n=1 Tax=Calothrix parasitica NIES-267 TaxID=1973488 RepID=A0A1Z4M1A9_9CYAN|nr:ABC transporter-related protein [Calothrix parasitica NIES-267]
MVSINNKEEIAPKPQNNDSEVVLSVNGVSKRFCRDLKKSLFYGVQDIASEIIGIRGSSDKLRPKEFWALNDVSFELRRGEALGLVGKNGSGKSTLLRIIAGLIKPDAGTVEVNGRVAPLIALGAGFNPILTGRENIYANMSILGLSKEEIDERFDEVVEFAEIGDAIDSPVRSYSSGMAARLGFASAIHTDPDILLIDEVLAVGDIRFRAKCHRRLHKLRQNGTSFILVSHNTQAILNVCASSVYLLKGKLITSGNTEVVMNCYEKDLFFKENQRLDKTIAISTKNKNESSGIDIVSLFFRDSIGNEIKSPITGEECFLSLGYKSSITVNNIGISLLISELSGEGQTILSLSSFNDKTTFNVLPGEYETILNFPSLGLRPGLYTMKVFIRQDALHTYDCIESFRFSVESKAIMSQCLYYQPRKWEVKKKQ